MHLDRHGTKRVLTEASNSYHHIIPNRIRDGHAIISKDDTTVMSIH